MLWNASQTLSTLRLRFQTGDLHISQITIPLLTLSTLFAMLYLGYIVVDYTFKVRTIEVHQANIVPFDFSQVRGQNILLLDTKEVQKNIEANYYTVSDVSIKKKIPSTLIFRYTQRKPVAQVIYNNQYFLIDAAGFIFAVSNEPAQAPIIDAQIGTPAIGMIFEDAYRNIFHFLETMRLNGITVSSVSIAYPTKIVFESDNLEIVSDSKGDEKRVASLQMLLNGLKIEGRRPKYVDVRFDKPVVRF